MNNREWFYSLKPREMVEWLDSEHVEDELRFADECRDPGVTGWWPDERDCMAEAAEAPSDSREKLEADAVTYCDHFLCTRQRFNEAKLIALLDRQAAITERECDKPSWDYCETCEALAELKAKVDRIKLENMQLARDLGECMAERDELRERLSRAIDHAYAAISLVDLDGCWKDEGMA